MRIVGGKSRGLILSTPTDDRVRPTSDRVREAIFNILSHNDFHTGFRLEGSRTLDLFAGTGALGLEALSRGAKFVMFVDDHAESRALVRRNVEAMQATGVTKIWRRDATELGEMPPNAGGPFDLVFLDPPYRKDLLGPAMISARDGKWLTENALILAELAEDENFIAPAGFTLLDERMYGQTKVLVMRQAA